jgi:hypothetical protein
VFELSFGARSQSLGWVLGPGLLVSGLAFFLHARGQLSGLALGAGWLGTCLGLCLACSAFFRGLRLASQLDCRQGFQCWPAGPALGAVCWTLLSGPKLGAGFRGCPPLAAMRLAFEAGVWGWRPVILSFGACFRGWLSGLACHVFVSAFFRSSGWASGLARRVGPPVRPGSRAFEADRWPGAWPDKLSCLKARC